MKPLRSSPLILLFFAVSIASFMSACSMRIVYSYLDWIIPFYIDDYVTLTEKQKEFFDHATGQFLEWHRREELPRYEQFVVLLQDMVATPVDRQQILFIFDEVEAFWAASLAEAMPALLTLAATFNDKQLEEINSALQRDIKELRNKYGNKSDREQRDIWRKKTYDKADEWLGRVTAEQARIFELWSKKMINITDDWLAFRDSWRQNFLGLLTKRHRLGFKDEMAGFLLHPRTIYTDSYRQDVLQNRRHHAELLADLSTTLTAGQRQNLHEELDEIIDDLRAMGR
ncbi:MAG: DUF6279 family lipoprotein [Desulforhopalus sp.]